MQHDLLTVLVGTIYFFLMKEDCSNVSPKILDSSQENLRQEYRVLFHSSVDNDTY